MRALHLGPLHELLGRKDRLHLLGLLHPRLAHRLAMSLHRLQLLERRGIDLFGLFFRELQAFGHAVRHLAGHLLDGGAFNSYAADGSDGGSSKIKFGSKYSVFLGCSSGTVTYDWWEYAIPYEYFDWDD